MIKKRRILPLFLLGVLVFSLFASDVTACANGPNYWGNSFPGIYSPYKYIHPNKPSEYVFANKTKDYGYDGSHYGTHDWIADAALRSLRDPTKNPIGFEDWVWLINSNIAKNKWPVWNPIYGNDAQLHNKIRSYATFLFATQMPDMEKRKGHPQKIIIPEEGIVIEDFHPKTENKNKWVGQYRQHSFHFQVITFDGICSFVPKKTTAATKAKQLGEAAIKCIGKTVEDGQGLYKSAMQPEGASGWLGAMTHYIADLTIPAHLLESNDLVYSSQYHNWFENQLASLTKWDRAYKANGGPETTYFSWDIGKVGKTGQIIPIPPDIALTTMAVQTIIIAYRSDENQHQHIVHDGSNTEEASNCGLYLNNKENHWDWKKDLDNHTRSGSLHKYFYDKVEKLLCWATYYIACAMQYCMNKGKKELSNNQSLNPDYYVTRDIVPRQPPDPDPYRPLDDWNTDPTGSSKDNFRRLFKNLGMVIGPLITGIATMLGRMFHIIGR